MTDIVERLRTLASWTEENYRAAIAWDGAAEITRLRAEVERLGRDYETARMAHDRRVTELNDHCIEVATLRAENARLREALRAWEYAVEVNVTMEGPVYRCVHTAGARIAWEKTRAALAGAEGEGE